MRHLSDSFGITHYPEVFQGQRDQRLLTEAVLTECSYTVIIVRVIIQLTDVPGFQIKNMVTLC